MNIVKRATMARNRGASCRFPPLGLIGPRAYKCLLRKGGYKEVPLGRAFGWPEEPSRVQGAAVERLGTPGAYHIRSTRVLLKLLLKKR